MSAPAAEDPPVLRFTAAILAGGRSRRLGRDKALLSFEGRTLLERALCLFAELDGPCRADEVLIVGRKEGREQGREDVREAGREVAPGRPAFRAACVRLRRGPTKVRAVSDDVEGRGPLGGLYTALRCSRSEWVFVAACDMPLLSAREIELLASARGRDPEANALAFSVGGRIEPLAAFYSRRLLPSLERLMEEGGGPTDLVKKALSVVVELAPGSPEAKHLLDVDTEEDLRSLCRRGTGA